MKIKLVALDMDGTVLDSKSEIRASTIDAISRVTAIGVHVVLCTGRTLVELGKALEVLPGIKYLILSNGAIVYAVSSGIDIYSNLLSKDNARRIFELLKCFDMMFEVYADHNVYVDKYCWDHPEEYGAGFLKKLITETYLPVNSVERFLEKHVGPVEKINIFFKETGDKKKALDLCKGLKETITPSIHHNIEINSKTANKGRALKKLSGFIGIKRNEIIAIGDSASDISMMRFSGTSIAMGNAIKETQSVADAVTDSNDQDGVAKALYGYVLDEEASKCISRTENK